MKGVFEFFGVIVVTTMIGLAFAGCEGPMGPQGEQGEPNTGPAIVWLGEFAAHPTGNIAEGSAYFNTTLGRAYIFWDGQWRRMSQAGGQGQTGEAGNPGEIVTVTGIAISGAGQASADGYNLSLSANGQATLAATVHPPDALVQTVLWVSDNPAVTVVSASRQTRFSLATGSNVAARVAAGTPPGTTAMITATALGSGADEVAATIRVAVSADPPPRESFWAVNHSNVTFNLTAELLAYDDHSEIWVEVGAGITQAQARAFADEYADMREKLLNAYSRKNFTASGRHFANILDYANWLTRGDNGEGRLTILLLDIRAPPGLIIGGYFHGRDLLNAPFSNRRDMVYINSSFVAMDWNGALGVLAHEVVHLINAAETMLGALGGGHARATWMDLWIDEVLAEKSHYIVFGENNTGRVDWFANDPVGTISRGNNFFVWGNRREQDTRAILDDYATAFLFGRWLFLQA